MRSPAPAYAADLNDETIEAARGAIGPALIDARARVGEVQLFVEREGIVGALRALRDTPGLDYQQLMEIAGVDYPDRAERFDVVYCLLSLTRNHRIQVHVATDDEKPVPSSVPLWPVAGWLEREVYDMYGVLFAGNPDLRRILTDYGFRGHPQRKDFPLTGFVELRYSEEEKRVAYSPVSLAQDFRTFDFMSPWEGAEYVLPGDEKAPQAAEAKLPEAKGAQTPATASQIGKADAEATEAKAPPSTLEATTGKDVKSNKVSEDTSQTGAGKPHPHAGPKPADPDVIPGKGGQNQ